MGDCLAIVPVTMQDAREWVDRHHRHHRAPESGLFALAVAVGTEIKGVAIVGRPVARALQDGWTSEVTRVAVVEGVPNACSKLYAASWRAARALGWRRLITYTLASEPGTSLVASGWKIVGQVKGRSWDTPSRPRIDGHPLDDKVRWEALATSRTPPSQSP